MGFSQARCRFQKVPGHHPAVISKTLACHVITQLLFLKTLACHVITRLLFPKQPTRLKLTQLFVSKNVDIIWLHSAITFKVADVV
jgi:heme/copper-type cytochrome/quinol oxidase subunit 3